MPSDVLANIEDLAEELQVVRQVVESPIAINSGYRCYSHNKAVGGAKSSQHLLGKAVDIVIKGHKPNDTHSLLELLIKDGVILEGGLGKYNTFTHYDIREKKARW
tara:strand:+ start:887 stop:1201 length:315 start_codon:yes stop_codon:yes gene_type:complete